MTTFSTDDRNRLLKYLQISPLVTTYLGSEAAQGEVTQLQSRMDALELFDTANNTDFVGEVVELLDKLDAIATRLETVNPGIKTKRVEGEYWTEYNPTGPAAGDVLRKNQYLARIGQLLGFPAVPGTSGRVVRS